MVSRTAAGPRADPVSDSGLGLLLLFLPGGGRGVVALHLADALLELLDARAQRAGEIGQPVRAEEDQHDDQDDQQFLRAKAKHVRLLFSVAPHLTPGVIPRARPSARPRAS